MKKDNIYLDPSSPNYGTFSHINTIKFPKPVYYITIGGHNNVYLTVVEPAKYPNFWHRFWMKALLGWVVKKV